MADKLICPGCGFEMEIAGESADGGAVCASCGKEIAADRPKSVSSASGPARTPKNLGCLLGKVFLALVAVVTLFLLLVPVPTGREASPENCCLNNLKAIGIALHHYNHQYGRFPPPYTVDEEGNRLHSWRALILPFLDRQDLFASIRFDEPWDSEHNRRVGSEGIRLFQCPSSASGENTNDFLTNYVMITGPGTVGESLQGTRVEDIADPYDATVLVAEVAQSDINWMEPRDYDFAAGPHRLVTRPDGEIGPTDLSSYHRGVVNMLMVDGSVKRVPVDIDEKTFKALMTIRGGEEVELE